ncbi:leucine-rich repeat and death domain-containing protein 1 isoform X2 [Hyalella azteca]|nr:leucine-rich repeat and death domain-containing protein 1 isoform X2 [Hyalella azteca]XP_047738459.1 leucine-rich repeat and death domain-containing protein 1 isoform X2 [Hyalella azteca]
MRINCEVTSLHRGTAAVSCRQPRAVRSTLSVACAVPGNDQSVCLHLCNAANKLGTQYKILNNVSYLFSKFIEEGKFTIRLINPNLDLLVKTDAEQAKKFVKILSLCVRGKVPKNLSSVEAIRTRDLTKPEVSLNITSQQDYPVKTAFPAHLQQLIVTECKLNRVEGRILRLRRLEILNLSDNLIVEVPRTVADMAALTELVLSGNKIASLPAHLFDGKINATLRKLDLARNQLVLLPASLCLLNKLFTLDVSSNQLMVIPLTIKRLASLQYLNLSDNPLTSLPFAVSEMPLTSLSFDYILPHEYVHEPYYSNSPPVLPLTEMAARTLLGCKHRDPEYLHHLTKDLPSTLRRRLMYFIGCDFCSGVCVSYGTIYYKDLRMGNFKAMLIEKRRGMPVFPGSHMSCCSQRRAERLPRGPSHILAER